MGKSPISKRWSLILCSSVLLIGCGQVKIEQSTPVKQTKTQENSTPATLIKNSQIKINLTSANGVTSTLYFYAPNEKVEQASDSSCYANKGDHMRFGQYSLYLSHSNDAIPAKQNVPLFGDPTLTFNDDRTMWQIFKDPTKKTADLLTLYQQNACNGKMVALFSLTSDGGHVKQIPFRTTDATKETLYVSGIKQRSPTVFQTTSYNNATGIHTNTTWRWNPEEFELLQIENIDK